MAETVEQLLRGISSKQDEIIRLLRLQTDIARSARDVPTASELRKWLNDVRNEEKVRST